MPGIPFKTLGSLISDGVQTALLLSFGGKHQVLRLGFVLRGTEETLLPETLLDDWGHEIRGADLYLWVRENAVHFPRAELFGFDLNGQPSQCFLRDLDLTASYTCYAFADSSAASLKDGRQLTQILVPATTARQLRKSEVPAEISFPLSDAAVEWWTVDRAAAQRPDFDFFRMLEEDENR